MKPMKPLITIRVAAAISLTVAFLMWATATKRDQVHDHPAWFHENARGAPA